MSKKRDRKEVTVGFVSLGCPKNTVDSERMLAEIGQAGYVLTAEPDRADVVVINTCAFIAPARAEAMDAIKRALRQKRHGRTRKVIVAGCLPQREGAGLLEEAKGIDAIVGLGQRDNIAAIISRTLADDGPRDFLGNWPEAIHDDRTRLRITPQHFAYLRISEGCNRNCSFCTVPGIRGRFRSKARDVIAAEAQELVAAGAVELNIIAQDTTSYGKDLGIENGLSVLLSDLEQIPNLVWARLLYLYPTEIDHRLIETVAGGSKTVHYFDIPIQHINSQVLRQMHRAGTREQVCKVIEDLRAALPDCILRTTVIVGFPGETDEQFTELVDFIKWAGFDHLGCFTFFPESGTAAAQMPNQIPDRVKRQRREELMLTQQQIVFEKNKNIIGTEIVCLVDATDGRGRGEARFFGQAPEIDSLCLVENCTATCGQFVKVRVTGTRGYDLLVRQV